MKSIQLCTGFGALRFLGLFLLGCSVAVSGCSKSSSGGGGGSGGSGGGTTTPNPTPIVTPVQIRISDQSATRGDILVFSQDGSSLIRTIAAEFNGNPTVLPSGTAVGSVRDGAVTSKLRFLSNIAERTTGFSATDDGELFVDGLVRAAVIQFDPVSGLLFVGNDRNLNSQDGNVIAVSPTATGPDSANPASVVFASATLNGQPLAVHYDSTNDVLQVYTTFSELHLFENFRTFAGNTNASPSQTVSLRNDSGNFLGFAFGATFNDDGSLLFVSDAGNLNVQNDTDVFRYDVKAVTSTTTTLAGTSLAGGVANTADFAAIVYDDVLDLLTVNDRFEQRTIQVSGASGASPSVVFLPTTGDFFLGLTDNSDEVEAGNNQTAGNIKVLKDDPTNGSSISEVSSDLTSTSSTETQVTELGSDMSTEPTDIDTDRQGRTFTSFKMGNSGGISIASNPGADRTGGGSARVSDGSKTSTTQDRQIFGPNSGLDCPLAVTPAQRKDVVFVLDDDGNGNYSISAFNKNASGDVAPLFSVPVPAGFTPTDIAYEGTNDTCYICGQDQTSNSRVLAFDDICMLGNSAMLDRTISLVDNLGNSLGSNFTSLVVLPNGLGEVYVVDAGSTGVQDDGQILGFNDSSKQASLSSLAETIVRSNLVNPESASGRSDGSIVVVDGGDLKSIPSSQLTLGVGEVTSQSGRSSLSISNLIAIAGG